MGKVKRRMVVIDDNMSQESIALITNIDTLVDALNSLKINFDSNDEIANAKSLIEKLADWEKTDHHLKPLIEEFNRYLSLAKTKITEAETRYSQDHLKDFDKKQSLCKGLTSAHEHILKLYENSFRHAEAILSRYSKISPEIEDSQVLEEYAKNARKELQSALDEFIGTFSSIHFNNAFKKENKSTIQGLGKFINNLRSDLKLDNLHLNPLAIDIFCNRLQDHLDIKTIITTFKTQKPLDPHAEIATLVADLFDTSNLAKEFINPLKWLNRAKTESQEIFHRKQIAATYNILAKLTSFPLKSIQNCALLRELSAQNDTTINEEYERLTSILLEQITVLNDKLKLFSASYDTTDYVKAAKINKRHLEELYQELIKNKEEYQNYQSKNNNIDDATIQLDLITHQQNEILKKLQTQSKKAATYKNRATSSTQELEEQYQKEFTHLTNKLERLFSDIKLALKLYPDDKYFKKNLNEVSKRKKEALKNSSQDLAEISALIKKNQAALEKDFVKKIRSKLTQKFLEDIEESEKRKTELRNDSLQLSEKNPYKIDLGKHKERTLIMIDNAIFHYSSLPERSAAGLSAWNHKLTKNLEDIGNAWGKYNELSENARIIQARLENAAYKTSLELISTINAEFLRILNKNASKIKLQEMQNSKDILEQLSETSNVLEHNYLSIVLNDAKTTPERSRQLEQIKNWLDEADPRLYKLLSLQIEFEKINEQYIHPTITLCNDRRYSTSLIAAIKTNLRKKYMEEFSDGVLSEYRQWIRKNVLHPLQAIVHQINGLFTGNRDIFFPPTIGGTKTEHELINAGNKAYINLSGIPTTAA